MNFAKQRGTGDGDKPTEVEIEGNIRELVRRDATGSVHIDLGPLL